MRLIEPVSPASHICATLPPPLAHTPYLHPVSAVCVPPYIHRICTRHRLDSAPSVTSHRLLACKHSYRLHGQESCQHVWPNWGNRVVVCYCPNCMSPSLHPPPLEKKQQLTSRQIAVVLSGCVHRSRARRPQLPPALGSPWIQGLGRLQGPLGIQEQQWKPGCFG